MSRDPVCGREVDPLRARGVGIWGGRTFYFCSMEHREAFARDPGAYASGARAAPSAPVIPVVGARSGRAGKAGDRVESVPERIDSTERTSSPPAIDRATPEPAPRANTPPVATPALGANGSLQGSPTPPTGMAASDAPGAVPYEVSSEQSAPLRPPLNRLPMIVALVAALCALLLVAWLVSSR